MKKHRDEQKCFIAEGPKVVADLLPLLSCQTLYATAGFIGDLKKKNLLHRAAQVTEVTQSELERLSLLKAPREALAVFRYISEEPDSGTLAALPSRSLCIALDSVQDPGNLGTILRIADWFGIEHVFASRETVDVYSPKVVQATMGAIGRVHIHYTDLKDFISHLPADTPVWGTFLDGTNIYQEELQNRGLIIMGNEGNGISADVAKLVNKRLLIPNYPVGRETSESLNVAVATAIVCAEFRRYNF